jgi:hypothetical protein
MKICMNRKCVERRRVRRKQADVNKEMEKRKKTIKKRGGEK